MKIEKNEISILIIDDEEISRAGNKLIVEKTFEKIGDEVLNIRMASNVDEMIRELESKFFHLVLLDQNLGVTPQGTPVEGIEKIPDIKAYQPNASIIVVTSNDDIDLVVRSMLLGANGFILKDINSHRAPLNSKQLINALKTAKESYINNQIEMLTSDSGSDFSHNSSAMEFLNNQLKSVASYNTHVLLTGETGLGKNHTARRLAELSRIANNQDERPFVYLDVNSIPSNLIESELFGYEKGSFTGATSTKSGLFEAACGGEIFIDEIQDLPLELQSKLLSVLENGTFRRVGGRFTLKTTARVILAANKDLEEMKNQGKFREDLLARISAFRIKLPALNERKEDIPSICNNLIKELCEKSSKAVNFSFNDFEEGLQHHFLRDNIPGNIRGIRNELELLMIMSPEVNGRKDFSKWKKVLKPQTIKNVIPLSQVKSISFSQFKKLRVEFINDKNFPGFKEARKIFEDKMVEDSMDKFDLDIKRAEALGLSASNLGPKVRRIKAMMKREGKLV